MAYVETLLSEYGSLTLSQIVTQLPLAAGWALLEARRSRLDPRGTIGWVDRCVMRANQATRRWFETHYRIIERGEVNAHG